MTRTVNIEVYCDNTEGERDIFGVFSDHRPDLPKPSNGALQEWVNEKFKHLEEGDSIKEAGGLKYEPNGEIVEFQLKE